jgi:MraZ protein
MGLPGQIEPSYMEPAVFLGKYSRTLDATSSFSLPSSFVGPLSAGAYLTQGFDRNLQVLTGDAFRAIYRTVVSLNITNPLARLLMRLVLGTAQELGVDASGQFTIPEELRQYANLNNEIFLVGQGEYFEIWAPELWGQQETQLRDAETNAGRFSALTVSVHSSTVAGGTAGS